MGEPNEGFCARLVDRVALFTDDAPAARPLKPQPFASEVDLRRFAEQHLNAALGLRLVAS
jgi:hypothetical protein